VGPVWSSLQDAAAAFCPPFEVAAETPQRTSLVLRHPESGEEIRLRYRSERGLFLRTYYLVIEAEFRGPGPVQAGDLKLRRKRLAWRRPRPEDAKRWSERLASRDFLAALKRLQVERLGISWEPGHTRWMLRLETLSGAVTVTFFPPLMTPNPLMHDEAVAVVALIAALRQASAGIPA
jgi:hypothetical protein